jgi:hypothetical protein
VLIFVRIPGGYTVYALVGLAIFGLYTVVDFNRLRRAGTDEAIPLADLPRCPEHLPVVPAAIRARIEAAGMPRRVRSLTSRT